MSSPSAVGAQEMPPPQEQRRVRFRRGGEAGSGARPGGLCCLSPPHPRLLAAGSRQSSDRRHGRTCHRGFEPTPHPDARARDGPTVAAPRDLDSDFPRGRLAAASLFFPPQ